MPPEPTPEDRAHDARLDWLPLLKARVTTLAEEAAAVTADHRAAAATLRRTIADVRAARGRTPGRA
jgi:hypothetical protein